MVESQKEPEIQPKPIVKARIWVSRVKMNAKKRRLDTQILTIGDPRCFSKNTRKKSLDNADAVIHSATSSTVIGNGLDTNWRDALMPLSKR